MRQDKLLLLGNSIGTRDAIQYAKSLGIWTIVTDYLEPEQCPEKRMADEYWMIDVCDLDRLEGQCRKEQVTGVFAATGEQCLELAGKLCRRLGLPFYASCQGEKAARDKQYFKEMCARFEISTPRQYKLEEACCPVIVKPVDSCAQQGLSLCGNREELLRGFEAAEQVSPSGRAVIEKYVDGDELCVWYLFRDGEIHLCAVTDVPYGNVNNRKNFARVNYRSKYYREYMETVNPKAVAMLRALGCREGVGYIQMMYQNGSFYFLEFGYRLDAIGSWRVLETLTGFNSLKWQVLLAMGRDPLKEVPLPKDVPETGIAGMTYFIWGKPGRIAAVEGLEAVRKIDGVEVFAENIAVGTEILPTDSMRQIAYLLSIVGEDPEGLEERLRRIKRALKVFDSAGQELLVYP